MQPRPFALLVAGALAASAFAGCSKGSDQSSSTTTTTTTQSSPGTSATTSAMGTIGDAAHGKAIFTANCAQCHGPTGVEGGIGPPLKNEKSRKNYAQTVAWIKNPQPPMPKLYPGTLNEKDVDDVAAFVQSL